jgi:alginate biosynthesis protein Alg44
MTRTPTLIPTRPATDPGAPAAPPRAPQDRGTHFPAHAHAAPRAAPRSGENLGLFGRLRATVISLFALTLGITAFGYALKQVHHILFVTSASAGKVAGPVYTVAMPREGMFFSLVPDDGVVKKGAAIASFEAPVLDLVRNQTMGTNMTPENLEKLMKVTVKGTITSPCDCKVQTAFVADGQYVARDQPLFELMPRDFTPYVVARFRSDQLADIATGDRVSFKVAGDNESRFGKITQLRAHGQGDTVDTDVMVTITPEDPIPAELLSRPAEVIAGGFMLPDLSGGSATAKDRQP